MDNISMKKEEKIFLAGIIVFMAVMLGLVWWLKNLDKQLSQPREVTTTQKIQSNYERLAHIYDDNRHKF